MAKDYYSILGITKNSSNDEIKSAFRKLAHKYHPDKNQGNKEAEAKFKEINEAYQTLSNEDKRSAYDRFGSEGAQGPNSGFGGFEQSGFGGFDFNGMGDIFSDFFGGQGGGFSGGQGGKGYKRGQDIEVMINISLSDSYFGVERSFSLQKTKECSDCNASGAKKGTQTDTCKDCSGRGVKTEARRTILGMINTQVECTQCHGSGNIPKEKCSTCRGKGTTHGRDDIQIKIPASVQHGSVMTLTGRGEAIMGGAAGDLYVRIHVDEDKIWKRSGFDLVRTIEVRVTDVLLGNIIDVDTFEGIRKVNIESGTQPGEIITEKGKGFSSGSRKGNIVYIVKVIIPKKINSKTKEYITKLKEDGI